MPSLPVAHCHLFTFGRVSLNQLLLRTQFQRLPPLPTPSGAKHFLRAAPSALLRQ